MYAYKVLISTINYEVISFLQPASPQLVSVPLIEHLSRMGDAPCLTDFSTPSPVSLAPAILGEMAIASTIYTGYLRTASALTRDVAWLITIKIPGRLLAGLLSVDSGELLRHVLYCLFKLLQSSHTSILSGLHLVHTLGCLYSSKIKCSSPLMCTHPKP